MTRLLNGGGMAEIKVIPLAFHFPFHLLSWLRLVKLLVETEVKLKYFRNSWFMLYGLDLRHVLQHCRVLFGFIVLILLFLQVVDGALFCWECNMLKIITAKAFSVRFVIKPYVLNAYEQRLLHRTLT